MQIGPVQLLVVGHPAGEPHEDLRRELEQLRAAPGIRLLDLLHVRKHEDGRVERIELTDLTEAEAVELGALVGALIGLGAGGEAGAEEGALAGALAAEEGAGLAESIWFADDSIPPGSAATLVLIEHQWAIGIRDRLRDTGGVLLADAWVHPSDLVDIGLINADDARRELGV